MTRRGSRFSNIKREVLAEDMRAQESRHYASHQNSKMRDVGEDRPAARPAKAERVNDIYADFKTSIDYSH